MSKECGGLAWLSSFTIELALMLSRMSHGVVGVLRTDLALSKVCLLELGHNETVCADIKLYPDIQVTAWRDSHLSPV